MDTCYTLVSRSAIILELSTMKRIRQYKQRPSKNLCSSAGMPRTDSLLHFYLVKCNSCPEWTEKHDRHPIAACRSACQHASREAGHEAYVINVSTLNVVHRYRFDTIVGPKDPTDDPPF